MSYYPVLKLSNAEMGALSNLKEETKGAITPIIESKMIAKKEIDDWPSTFRTLGTYLLSKVGSTTRFIYDFHTAFKKIGEIQELTDESGKNIVQHCIAKLTSEKLNFIPCLHFDAPDWMIESIMESHLEEVAIRIRCNDFNSPLEEFVMKRITEKIINKSPKKKFIIILDYYDSSINEQRIKTSVLNFSKIHPSELVLVLTSCLDNADSAPQNAFSIISSRDDIKTYFKLKKQFPELQFGDYTVRLKPQLENANIDYYNTYLKIFYSSEDDYHVGKSTQLKDDGVNTFIDICQEIVNSDVYKGSEFSAGDKAIFDCAMKAISISGHQKPIEYGINHHIELTVNQLNVVSPVFPSLQ